MTHNADEAEVLTNQSIMIAEQTADTPLRLVGKTRVRTTANSSKT
jgi:hypothetical protein